MSRPKYVTTVRTGGSAGVDPPVPAKKAVQKMDTKRTEPDAMH